MNTWLTVDTDDLRHLPRHQGHPTRSNEPFEGDMSRMSPRFQTGWAGFHRWMATHDHAVTVFVITDLFDDPDFEHLLKASLEAYGQRLTVGCHGHTHRSWSAWGEAQEGFRDMLERSTGLLHQHAEKHVRPWFRAPAGYVASWMASALVDHGFSVDSSVNPSWLVRRKTNGEGWGPVKTAMTSAGLVERSWNTSFTLPVNGPALFRFPLSIIARRAWRRLPPPLNSDGVVNVANGSVPLVTAYVHVLDFARDDGEWTPPL